MTGSRRSADVTCYLPNKKEIKIQVKTGKWQAWEFGDDVLFSADAIFNRHQIEKGFHYAVFIIHENYETIKEALVFSRAELKELNERTFGKNNVRYMLSRVESIPMWQKYIDFQGSSYSIYTVERDMVEHPTLYRERWDKIKEEKI